MPWRNSLGDKPLEYWAVIVGMAIYVTMRDEQLPLMKRVCKTLASALLSFALSESVAPYVRGSEVFAAIAIMALGLIVLDVGVALVQDRELLREVIRARLGLPQRPGPEAPP